MAVGKDTFIARQLELIGDKTSCQPIQKDTSPGPNRLATGKHPYLTVLRTLPL